MNAHAVSHSSLQRRLIARRRARALFLSPTTQHVSSSRVLLRELARAALAVIGVAAWGVVVVLFAQ